MKKITGILLTVAVMWIAGASLLAHEETYKGTVLTIEATKIQVKVIDDKTKKESPMSFSVNAKTKVLRGDTLVSFADAHIQKDERIAVTVNHDDDATVALVIRLAQHDSN